MTACGDIRLRKECLIGSKDSPRVLYRSQRLSWNASREIRIDRWMFSSVATIVYGDGASREHLQSYLLVFEERYSLLCDLKTRHLQICWGHTNVAR